jgi:hypothetical protein
MCLANKISIYFLFFLWQLAYSFGVFHYLETPYDLLNKQVFLLAQLHMCHL